METTMNIELCEKCRGAGQVPSGHVDMWGRSCWRMCERCDGLGAIEVEPDATTEQAA